MSFVPVLRIYLKPGCPLCEEALEAVEEARARIPFRIEPVNILLDPEAYRKYWTCIPVGVLGEHEVFQVRTTPEAIIQCLAKTPAA